MAWQIVDPCVGCWACVDVCPSDAITEQAGCFTIDARRCTECDGDFADPQCASICPIEGAILDSAGVAINPPGSLTGIPPERLAAIQTLEQEGQP